MPAADAWEVVRHGGDHRGTVITTHKSIELAEKAYAAAVEQGFYAVDVSFLPGGKRLMFQPLFGIANGLFWVDYHGPVYSDNWVNDLMEQEV